MHNKDHWDECPHCEATLGVVDVDDCWYETFTSEDDDHVFRCRKCRRVIVGSISHNYPTLMQRKPVEADFLRCSKAAHHERHRGTDAKLGDQCRAKEHWDGEKYVDERCHGILIVNPCLEEEFDDWRAEAEEASE